MFEINGKQFINQANRPPGTLLEYDLSDLNIQSNKSTNYSVHFNSKSFTDTLIQNSILNTISLFNTNNSFVKKNEIK